MSDLISREALLEVFDKYKFGAIKTDAEREYTKETVMNFVKEQPSVTDTNVGGKWISCSERLPHSEDKYRWINCNVTVMRSHYPTSTYDYCDSPYDEYFVTSAIYDASQKIWHLGENTQLNALIGIEDLPLNGDCVIAWVPLPQPYKAGQT